MFFMSRLSREVQGASAKPFFNSKETSKNRFKTYKKIHFKTFQFFKLWFGQETAVAEV